MHCVIVSVVKCITQNNHTFLYTLHIVEHSQHMLVETNTIHLHCISTWSYTYYTVLLYIRPEARLVVLFLHTGGLVSVVKCLTENNPCICTSTWRYTYCTVLLCIRPGAWLVVRSLHTGWLVSDPCLQYCPHWSLYRTAYTRGTPTSGFLRHTTPCQLPTGRQESRVNLWYEMMTPGPCRGIQCHV